MQMNRLFEIVYILLDKKTVTARELSEHFEVSSRTIYRDVETLSMAGIPIYTNKGKGGGICLLDNFVLNKSMLSDQEQVDILSSLQGLNALNMIDVEPVLKKLAAVFDKSNVSWIDIDFTYWGSNDLEKEKFYSLKKAILSRNPVSFDYYGSSGKKSVRIVEPFKIIFKGQGLYLYGYCRLKSDERMFKITRINNLQTMEEIFDRNMNEDALKDLTQNTISNNQVTIILKIDEKMAYRVYDEFSVEFIEKNADNSFLLKMVVPENDWIYGYIMTFGEYAEVIEPLYIREEIKKRYENGLKKYL